VEHHKSEKITTSDKMAGFINNNKYILWGILALLAVSTIVFAIIDKNIKDTNVMYANKSVEIQDEFEAWFNASEDDKNSVETKFLSMIDEAISFDKSNILMEKALFTRGQLYLQKEEWVNAIADFSKLAEISPESYLAAVSLYNSATAMENNGDPEAALEVLEKLTADYKTSSPIVAEALFNMGRINETLNNSEAALKSYNELASTYSSSNWTNLAKTRIISLKASGVSQ
jgi:TolA-binding protein